jgi:hypothetical protein
MGRLDSIEPLMRIAQMSNNSRHLLHEKSFQEKTILNYCTARFFPDFAGKKRFAFGEQPFVRLVDAGYWMLDDSNLTSMRLTDDFSTYQRAWLCESQHCGSRQRVGSCQRPLFLASFDFAKP